MPEPTAADLTQIRANLTDANNAYHQLMMGRSVVSTIDQNGEKVQFTQVNKDDLKAYIQELKLQLPEYRCDRGFIAPPLGFLFR